MTPDINLDLLRCFAVVAETRNFTAAGARLSRSQSAVSVRIKKLEEILNGPLLIRNNHEVTLTERGHTLLPKAKRLLQDSERLLAEMRDPSVSGRLSIGILEYIAPHRMPALLSAVQRRLPEAELHFCVGLSQSLMGALEAGEITLALALHDPASETSTVVATDPLVWVEGLQQHEVAPGDTVELCLMQAPCIYRQAALEVLSRTETKYREIMTTNNIQSVRNAVVSGMGISVLGASCLGDGLRVSHRMHDLDGLPQATLSMHGSDYRKNEVVAVMRQVLADHLRNGFAFDRKVPE